MFDFQKLQVYSKAKSTSFQLLNLVTSPKFDQIARDQMKRASLSIILNIAEGSSRFSNKDRRRFMIISRGSVFECAALLDYLHDCNKIDRKDYDNLIPLLEELSKMLYGIIKRLS